MVLADLLRMMQLEMVDARRQQGRPSNPGQPLFYATTIFAGATLAVAALRLAQRFNSPTEKHTRDVDKNKVGQACALQA